MEKLPLLESAITGPAPQPASTSKAGAAMAATAFRSKFRASSRSPCDPFGLAWWIEPSIVL
jgi:hypothetical protein